MPENSTHDPSAFNLELLRIQLELHQQIIRLCGSTSAAQDILQAVNLILIRRQDEWDPTRGRLIAWAVKLAQFELLHRISDKKRDKICFSSELVIRIAEGLEAEEPVPTDRRLRYLEECLAGISDRVRELLLAHHGRRESVKAMAWRLKRTPGSVANSLYSARESLRLCIEGKMMMESR